MTRIVIEGCAIATMDGAGTEHADGHLLIEGDRLLAAGAGPAPTATMRSPSMTRWPWACSAPAASIVAMAQPSRTRR